MRSVFVGLLLILAGTPAFAQAGPIYKFIPEGATCQNSHGPSPLRDSRGFYMGYYQPVAPQIVNPLGTDPTTSTAAPAYGGGSYGSYGGSGYGGGYQPVPAVTNPLGTSPNGFPSLNTGTPVSSSGPTVPNAYSSNYYYRNNGYNGGQISNPLGIGTSSSSPSYGGGGGHHHGH